jgi:hypothetical protein
MPLTLTRSQREREKARVLPCASLSRTAARTKLYRGGSEVETSRFPGCQSADEIGNRGHAMLGQDARRNG